MDCKRILIDSILSNDDCIINRNNYENNSIFSIYTYEDLINNLIIPDYDITYDSKKELVTIEYDYKESSISDFEKLTNQRSGTSILKEIKPYQAKKNSKELINYLHDFTFSVFYDLSIESTDKSFIEMFKMRINQDDNLTPDFFYKVNENDFIICEFTTRSFNSKEIGEKALREKLYKYYESILIRNEKLKDLKKTEDEVRIRFVVIVVQNNRVLSNINTLSEDLITELMIRFRLARMINRKLLEMKLTIDQKDEDLSLREKELKLYFKNIELKKDLDPLSEIMLDEYYYEDLTTEELQEDIKENVKMNLDKNNDLTHNLKFTDEELKDLDKGNIFKMPISLIKRNLDEFKDLKNKYIQSLNEDARRTNLKSICHFPGILPKFSNISYNETVDFCKQLSKICLLDIVDESGEAYLWDEIITKNLTEELEGNFNEESVQDQYQRAMNPSEKNDETYRRTYHRVYMDDFLKDNVRISIEIAKKGLWKKMFKDSKEVIENEKRTKEKFRFDVGTDDIEYFINNEKIVKDLFSLEENNKSLEVSKINSIIEDSLNLHSGSHTKEIVIKFMELISNCKFFKYCKFISDIGSELTISLKQHTGKNEFILKRLKNFNCYLLIRPTNYDSHIFYSILIPKDEIVTDNLKYLEIFNKVIDCKSCYISEFTSVNKDKLNNMIGCESMMINLFSIYLNSYLDERLDINEILDYQYKTGDLMLPFEYIKIKNLFKILLTSFLIHSEDKKQTENLLTTMRFVYMEGFISYPQYPDFQKMLREGKYPELLRSRLTTYFLKNILDSIEKMISLGGFLPQQKILANHESKIIQRNIISFVTGEHVENLSDMVNIFYLGYLNNKNEAMNSNKILSLYEKIINQELKFDNDVKDFLLSKKDKPIQELKHHEYKRRSLKIMINLLYKKIKNSYDKDVEEYIESCFLFNLANTDITTVFGTLKSSSTFDSEKVNQLSEETRKEVIRLNKDNIIDMRKGIKEDFIEEECLNYEFSKSKHRKLNIKPTRTKVMKAGLEHFSECDNFCQLLKNCYEVMMDRNRLDVDIFDKTQHGGIREIYILNFESRVLQYTIELMARKICELFPCEMMTHPQNKDKLVYQFKYDSTEMFKGRNYVNFNTSDDAEKWNQNHLVSKFGVLLLKLMPKIYHNFIINVLDLWFKRNLKLDDRLIGILEYTTTSNSKNELFNSLFYRYKSKHYSKDILNDKLYSKGKSNFISVKSGFMQGILHYLSSLYHVGALEMTELYSNYMISKFLLSNGYKQTEFLITKMVSSDDSSMMISLPYLQTKDIKNMAFLANFTFDMKTSVAKSLGILRSIKSTQNTPFVMEFNSIFYFSDNRYQAFIKQAISCLTMSEQDNFISKQEELSTSLTQLLENGLSFIGVSLCNYSQAKLFYRLMGSSILPSMSVIFMENLKVLKDPSLGYFLMDNPICAGVMGYNYNMWNLLTKSEYINILYKSYLSRAIKERLLEKERETGTINENDVLLITKTGLFSSNISIPFGENRKLEKFKEDFGITSNEDVIQIFEEDPQSLYFRSFNAKDNVNHLKLKLISPGVTQSFSSGQGMPRLMSMSVYLVVNAIAYVRYDLNSGTIDKNQKFTKTSIMKRHFDLMNVVERIKETEINMDNWNEKEDISLTALDINILFPNNMEYETLRNYFNAFSVNRLTKKLRDYKMSKVVMTVIENKTMNVKLIDLLKWKWFGYKKIHFNERYLEKTFNEYKTTFTWLDDDYVTTLKQSPFCNQVQLYNFIIRLDQKGRTVRLLSSNVKTYSKNLGILTLICRNQFPTVEYSLETKDFESSAMEDVNVLSQILLQVNNSPLKPYLKTQMIRNLFVKIDLNINIKEEKRIKYNQFKIINNFYLDNSKEKYINLFSDLVNYSRSIFGFYVQPQTRTVDSIGNTLWLGKGIWFGVYNKTKIIIHINSFQTLIGKRYSKITQIELSDMKIRSDLVHLIRNFNKIHHLEEMFDGKDEEEVRKPNFFLDAKGVNLNKGIPIIINKTITYDYDERRMFNINVQMEKYNRIKLICLYDYKNIHKREHLSYRLDSKKRIIYFDKILQKKYQHLYQPITLLSFSVSPSEELITIPEEFANAIETGLSPLIADWISCNRSKRDVIMSEILQIMEIKEKLENKKGKYSEKRLKEFELKLNIDIKQMQDWLLRSLKYCLNVTNIRSIHHSVLNLMSQKEKPLYETEQDVLDALDEIDWMNFGETNFNFADIESDIGIKADEGEIVGDLNISNVNDDKSESEKDDFEFNAEELKDVFDSFNDELSTVFVEKCLENLNSRNDVLLEFVLDLKTRYGLENCKRIFNDHALIEGMDDTLLGILAFIYNVPKSTWVVKEYEPLYEGTEKEMLQINMSGLDGIEEDELENIMMYHDVSFKPLDDEDSDSESSDSETEEEDSNSDDENKET